jgi:hypothetical protein
MHSRKSKQVCANSPVCGALQLAVQEAKDLDGQTYASACVLLLIISRARSRSLELSLLHILKCRSDVMGANYLVKYGQRSCCCVVAT